MRPGDRSSGFGRAVFLDRDGVLIADVHHLTSVDQLRLLPRVPEALARLRGAGWRLIITTNQSVVARGWITEERLQEIHRALEAMLRERGAEIDAIYYCPHHPEGAIPAYRRACECRKPNPGMLVRAAEEWRLDLGASVIVGNAASDVEAGWRAGCRTVLIRAAGGGAEEEGSVQPPPARIREARKGEAKHRKVRSGALSGGAHRRGEEPRTSPVFPDYVAADLEEAAGWILTLR